MLPAHEFIEACDALLSTSEFPPEVPHRARLLHAAALMLDSGGGQHTSASLQRAEESLRALQNQPDDLPLILYLLACTLQAGGEAGNEEVTDLLSAAAQLHHAPAVHLLAQRSLKAKDSKTAKHWLSLAAQAPGTLPQAQFDLAALLLSEHPPPLSWPAVPLTREQKQASETAAGWVRKAATQGHVDAMATLGQYYLSGFGVAENHHQAYRWLQQPARLEGVRFVKARLSLSAIVLGLSDKGKVKGEGKGHDIAATQRAEKEIDPNEAIRWLRQLATGGDADVDVDGMVLIDERDAAKVGAVAMDSGSSAALALATFFARQEDDATALAWARRALAIVTAEVGTSLSEQTQARLAGIHWHIAILRASLRDEGDTDPTKRGLRWDCPEAWEHALLAAQAGHTQAQALMGLTSAKGLYGKAEDISVALHWLRKAKASGCAQSAKEVGRLELVLERERALEREQQRTEQARGPGLASDCEEENEYEPGDKSAEELMLKILDMDDKIERGSGEYELSSRQQTRTVLSELPQHSYGDSDSDVDLNDYSETDSDSE